MYTPEQVAAIRKTNKTKLVWGLICLIAPTALLIVSILLYAIVNFVFSGMSPETGSVPTIVNVLLFLCGTLVVFTWLPGIIIGIVLLATRPNV